ncbi:type II toxin-antitoxin system PemK/MazF family toxin [Limosilactobacillus albertensis]|uniref:Type II toxin-antitoxin system PemK/MazF family toxin n=1 Tax=Limosilactobacillus albertensis TaxID=2759752 RepID=A0A839H3E1_9LACO|nr:type II toxin-antitoxin system PemK/MazF family toxin [Limosilactobacillus albertensis]MBB1124431.1 type II toxin-antitoxin system PemK/MazF family toxin [Limosilactobacillus albertensis]MCD7123155.1 type II toxin-antitoxin system PemK/MazF family toxin [Limosilactobacillus albertensis]
MVEYPQTGSIIYIDFDPSISVEIQKRRPAVVISNNILARTSPFAWVVPISHGSFNGEDYPLHVQLDKRTQIDGTVYIEQIKSFDFSCRKWQFVEMLPTDIFDEVRQKARLVI